MKINRDVLLNIPSRQAARYGFQVINSIQTMGPYRATAGVLVALTQLCEELGIEPRELLTAGDRWMRDSEFHDEQSNRGHRNAIKSFIREEF